MAVPIRLLPGAWQQIAPPGFQSIVAQVRSADVWIEMSAVAPSNTIAAAGVLIDKDGELVQLGTGQLTYAAYARPAGSDPAYINLIY